MTVRELNKIGVTILGKLSPKEFRERVKGAIPFREMKINFPYRRGGILYTKHKWETICAKTDYKCAYCGCELTMGNLSVDHIKPRSKGGTNKTDNLILACNRCNSKKSDNIIKKMLNEKTD